MLKPITIPEAAKLLGRKGGKSKSKAKAAAARANGKLGGRPRKSLDPKNQVRRVNADRRAE